MRGLTMAARMPTHTAAYQPLPAALLQVHGLLNERGPMTERQIRDALGLMTDSTRERVRRLAQVGAIVVAGHAEITFRGIPPRLWQAVPLPTPRRAGARRRPCLCCGRNFQSAGIHNRLCGTCGEGARGLSRQFQEAC
jgi:hypothetical protein